MSDQRFAYLRLAGGRFEEHPGQVPVECLNEIAIYRRCIASLASDAWRKDHPERARLPKNFTQDFQLLLSGIEKGSALPYLERPYADFGFDGYFEAARDKFTQLLEAVRLGRSPAAGVSRDTLKVVRGFGKSLRVNETVTLGHPTDSGKRVSLDATGRELIHRLDVSDATTVRAASLVGRIAEWNIEGRSFDLRHEGRLVKGATYDLETDVRDFVPNNESVPVVVTGPVAFNSDGIALSFEGHVIVADASDVLNYLDKALAQDKITGVNEAIAGMVRRWTPAWQRVAPNFGVTTDGATLRVEWERDGWDCSLEIDGDGGMFAHRYHAGDDEDVDQEFGPFDEAPAQRLVDSWTAGTW